MLTTYRGIIEKHSEYSIKETIATAQEVSKIREHGIMSVQALENTSEMIKA